MAKLPILEFPDERLRTRAAPVETVDDEVRRLVDDMLETMYAARGIGLAATQVDVHRRMIVMDVSDAQDRPLVMINPEYTPIGEERDLMSEGCLSIPEYYAEVPRALRSTSRRWIATASPSSSRPRACWPTASSTSTTTSRACSSSTTSRRSSATAS